MHTDLGHIRLLLVATDSASAQQTIRDLLLLDPHVEATLCTDTATVLDRVDREHFDAVAADIALPQEGALAVFTGLQELYPTVLRLVFADDPKQERFARAAFLAHQILPRPCDAGTLYDVLTDAIAIPGRMRDPMVSAAVAKISALPQAPGMKAELLGLLADDDIDLDTFEDALNRNPPLVAKIMQVANSAYYGSRTTVTSIGEGVSLLGLDTVRGIVTAARLFDMMPEQVQGKFPVAELWNHSIATSLMVRKVAREAKAPPAVGRAAFLAALLHDVGKFVFFLAHGEVYNAHLRRRGPGLAPLWQEELRLFGQHHGAAGARLLELWGLPRAITEAVELHHTPHRTRDEQITPLTLVHLANALVHAESTAAPQECDLDAAYLQRLLLPGEPKLWKEIFESAA